MAAPGARGNGNWSPDGPTMGQSRVGPTGGRMTHPRGDKSSLSPLHLTFFALRVALLQEHTHVRNRCQGP